VVLTGTGPGFCSGADTRDTMPPPNIDGMTLTRIATKAMTTLSDLVPRMRRMNKPIIAAESAYFRAAGINNGLTANELGLSFLLPRAIGSSRAFEFMLSGRDIDAAEAAEIGLVSQTVPDDVLMDTALDLADRINGWSIQGVALTKRLMWAGLETGSLQAAIEMESHTQLFVRLTTKNFEEATRARSEGRAPNFED
jgi:enoyl-CoA hydratase